MHRDRAGPAAPPPAHLALLLRAIAVGVTLVVRLPEIALRLDVETALQLQPYVQHACAGKWRNRCPDLEGRRRLRVRPCLCIHAIGIQPTRAPVPAATPV